jgi:hypothetical protein
VPTPTPEPAATPVSVPTATVSSPPPPPPPATSWVVHTIDDSPFDVGEEVAMASDDDGNFHITYLDRDNDDLLYLAFDPQYQNTKWQAVIDSERVTDNGGIVIESDGVESDGTVHTVHTSYFRGYPSISMTSASRDRAGLWSIETIDSDGYVGQYSDITLANTGATLGVGRPGRHPVITTGSDGRGLFAYIDDSSVQVGHCENASCSEATFSTVHTYAGGFDSVDITVDSRWESNGSDGLGVIAYKAGEHISLAFCLNLQCTDSVSNVIAAGAVGGRNAVQVLTGSDGFPVVIFATDTGFRYVACETLTCSSTVNEVVEAPHFGVVGIPIDVGDTHGTVSAAATGGTVGRKVVVAHIGDQYELRITICLIIDTLCDLVRTVETGITGVRSVDSTIGTQGHPAIIVSTQSDVVLLTCANTDCLEFTTYSTGVTPPPVTSDHYSPVAVYGGSTPIEPSPGILRFAYMTHAANTAIFESCSDYACTEQSQSNEPSLPNQGRELDVTIVRRDNEILDGYRDALVILTSGTGENARVRTYSCWSRSCSGAFRKESAVLVTYYDNTNNSMKLAFEPITNWNSEWMPLDIPPTTPAALGGNVGQRTRVVYDPLHSLVHTLDYSPSELGTLRHRTFDWSNSINGFSLVSTSEIAGGSSRVQYSALVVDEHGNPHVVYRQMGELIHSSGIQDPTSGVTTWSPQDVQVIDSSGDGYVDMTLDSSGDLHVSYYHEQDKILKYARGSTSSAGDLIWSTEVVDDSFEVGAYSAIDLDHTGSVYIAYSDGQNGNLKLAHN